MAHRAAGGERAGVVLSLAYGGDFVMKRLEGWWRGVEKKTMVVVDSYRPKSIHDKRRGICESADSV